MRFLFRIWMGGTSGTNQILKTWCNTWCQWWSLNRLFFPSMSRQLNFTGTTKIKHFWIKLPQTKEGLQNFLIHRKCQVGWIKWDLNNRNTCNNSLKPLKLVCIMALSLPHKQHLKLKAIPTFKASILLPFKAQFYQLHPKLLKMTNSSINFSQSSMFLPKIYPHKPSKIFKVWST